MWILLLFTAIAISLDALLIGIAYTLREIRITGAARIAVFLVTYVGMLLVTALGTLADGLIPEKVFSVIGGVLLIEIGCVFLIRSHAQQKRGDYDFDHSKEIDLKEGITLAFALSLDCVGAAFAFTGNREAVILLPLFAAALQLLFLMAGTALCKKKKGKLGKQFGEERLRRISELLAGGLLYIIGILRLFF